MRNPEISDDERIASLENIAKYYPEIQEEYKSLFSDFDNALKAKNHSDIVKILAHSKNEFYHPSVATRITFLVIQTLFDEINSEYTPFVTDRFESSAELINEYRRITLLLRRLELFNPEEDMFIDAVNNLSEFVYSPYYYRMLFKNELFETPEADAITLYESVISPLSLTYKVRYLLCFSEEYSGEYWYVSLADIFIGLKDFSTALQYLQKIEAPSPQVKELIAKINNMQ